MAEEKTGQISGRKPSYGLKSQMLYGMAEFSGGGAFVVINTFFTAFLMKALGMPAALAGVIPLIGHVWDAITDPIMGNITDRTVHKLGAKRFYILVGAILTGITFIGLWLTIPSESVGAKFAFYALMYVLFSTAFTVLMVPYNGLLPDMVQDYATRSKFSNVRMIWSTLGAMVSGLVPTFIIKDTTNESQYLICALLFGLLYALTAIATFAGTWEPQKAPLKASLGESFAQSVSVFKSRSFRIFVGIYLTGQCGMDFVSGMALYFVEDVLNGLTTCIPELLKQGMSVKLDGLGSFRATVSGHGAERIAAYSVQKHMRGIHMRFIPDQTNIDNISSKKFKQECSLVCVGYETVDAQTGVHTLRPVSAYVAPTQP